MVETFIELDSQLVGFAETVAISRMCELLTSVYAYRLRIMSKQELQDTVTKVITDIFNTYLGEQEVTEARLRTVTKALAAALDAITADELKPNSAIRLRIQKDKDSGRLHIVCGNLYTYLLLEGIVAAYEQVDNKLSYSSLDGVVYRFEPNVPHMDCKLFDEKAESPSGFASDLEIQEIPDVDFDKLWKEIHDNNPVNINIVEDASALTLQATKCDIFGRNGEASTILAKAEPEEMLMFGGVPWDKQPFRPETAEKNEPEKYPLSVVAIAVAVGSAFGSCIALAAAVWFFAS